MFGSKRIHASTHVLWLFCAITIFPLWFSFYIIWNCRFNDKFTNFLIRSVFIISMPKWYNEHGEVFVDSFVVFQMFNILIEFKWVYKPNWYNQFPCDNNNSLLPSKRLKTTTHKCKLSKPNRTINQYLKYLISIQFSSTIMWTN